MHPDRWPALFAGCLILISLLWRPYVFNYDQWQLLLVFGAGMMMFGLVCCKFVNPWFGAFVFMVTILGVHRGTLFTTDTAYLAGGLMLYAGIKMCVKNPEPMLDIICVLGIISSVFVYIQYFWGYGEGVGLSGNRNWASVFIATSAILCLRKWWCLFLAVMLPSLLFTKSVCGLLVFFTGAIYLMYETDRKKGVCLALYCLLAGLLYIRYWDAVGVNRLIAWLITIKYWTHFVFWTGAGLGNFGAQTWHMNDLAQFTKLHWIDAHCEPVTGAYEWGVFFLVISFGYLLRLSRRGRDCKQIMAAVAGILAGAMVNATFRVGSTAIQAVAILAAADVITHQSWCTDQYLRLRARGFKCLKA